MSEQLNTPNQPFSETDIDKKGEMNQLKSMQTEMPAWSSFCKDFNELLDPDNPSAVSLGYFIRRNLRQFKLTSIDELDVLSEVFYRAYKLVMLGGGVIIRHPAAWIRRTAFNYIRELSRIQGRIDRLEIDVADERVHSPIEQLIIETDIAILKRALQELDPDDQKLLILKVIEELSWAEIRILLAGEGKTVSEAALRKQKERALKRLRKIYHALRPLSDLERKLANE